MAGTVCFIGGIHGVGKSTVCKNLNEIYNLNSYKQRKLMMEVARKDNKTDWASVASLFDMYLEKVVELLMDKVLAENSQIVFIDCHYAIRSEKALRLGDNRLGGSYIPDIDKRIIQRVKDKGFKIKLIFLRIKPSIAHSRCNHRDGGILDYENTLDGLRKQQRFEFKFFKNYIREFDIQKEDYGIVNACESEEKITLEVMKIASSNNT